jgi:hypothetical protein
MTPTADQPPPDHIGRYRLLGRLGAGGMGTVYRAHDPHLDRIVAVKVPRLDGPPEQRAARVQRFQREARAAARILHPNVCPIFDVGEHDGAAFVVMAYVQGQSLDQVLAQRGAFADVREALGLIVQVLDGLAAVHAQGVVHRDVKPGNILLDGAGHPILTDFGLARPEESGVGLTSEGVVIGTPAYMAPEQAAGQPDQIGPWTDLYAVGVVLFQLLTGRLPFEGGTAAVLGAVVRDVPPSPRAFRPDLAADLETVVVRALRKDPRMRFVDARDFSAALANLKWPAVSLEHTHALALPAGPVALPASPSRRTRLKRRLLWLPGAVLAAGGGVVAAALVWTVITSTSDSVGGQLAAAAAGIALLAVPLMTLALTLWFVVEMAHVPEGLRYAAARGLAGRVRTAAANGVPLDLPDEMGETALMHAAAAGHTEVVKILLLYGVNTRAVSPLGQTAVEIAYARGHSPIVALLQKETRPQRRPEAVPGPQPSARRWLVGSALLGAVLFLGLLRSGENWPNKVSDNEVQQMVQAKQVDTLEVYRAGVPGAPSFLRGRVKSPLPLKFPGQQVPVRQGWFWAEVPGNMNQPDWRALDPGLRVTQMSSMPARPPSAWAIACLLALPAAVAALLAWPLGAAWWFPALRPARRPVRETAAAVFTGEQPLPRP